MAVTRSLRLPNESDDAFAARARRAAEYARVLVDAALANHDIQWLIASPEFPLYTEEGERRCPTVRIEYEQAMAIGDSSSNFRHKMALRARSRSHSLCQRRTTAGGLAIGLEKGGVMAICYSPDATRLYAALQDSVVIIDLRDMDAAPVRIELESIENRAAIHALSDGRLLIIQADSSILILQERDGKWQTERTAAVQPANLAYYCTSSAVADDGKTIAVANNGFELRLARIDSWEIIKTFKGLPKEVTSLVFSPDGKQFVAATRDGYSTVRTSDGEVIASRPTDIGIPYASSTGRWIAFGSAFELPLVDTASGMVTRKEAVKMKPSSVTFSTF